MINQHMTSHLADASVMAVAVWLKIINTTIFVLLLSCCTWLMEVALIKEMHQVKSFLLSRFQVSGPAAAKASEIASQLAQSMVAQINMLPKLTSDAAKSLTDALAASGYDEAGKAAILQAIDAGLTQNIINTPRNQKGSGNGWAYNYLWEGQTNYYTEQDWAGLLSSTKPLANKVQIIVDRFMSLGITNPDEWTIAWAIAVLILSHFRVFPKYKSIFAIVGDFKEALKACKKPWPFSFISNYPTTPKELPASVFAHAYDPDDQPVSKELERLKQTALKHIPLRKNNKLLIEEAKAAKSSTSCCCEHPWH